GGRSFRPASKGSRSASGSSAWGSWPGRGARRRSLSPLAHERALRLAAPAVGCRSLNPAASHLAQPPSRAHLALLVLTLINLLNYVDRCVISGMLPLLQTEFSPSDAEMGVL